MDAWLVQRAMLRASGADVHVVAGLVHEYGMADRLARERGADEAVGWARERERIEGCLRLYVGGRPIGVARRMSGCLGELPVGEA